MKVDKRIKIEVDSILKKYPANAGRDNEALLIDLFKAFFAIEDLEMTARILTGQMDDDFGSSRAHIVELNHCKYIIRKGIRETIDDCESFQEYMDQKEIRKLKKVLEEFQDIEIIKTAKQVAKDNIKQQIILINLFDHDEALVDNYERMFGLNLDIMTVEEIDQIDLTSLNGRC